MMVGRVRRPSITHFHANQNGRASIDTSKNGHTMAGRVGMPSRGAGPSTSNSELSCMLSTFGCHPDLPCPAKMAQPKMGGMPCRIARPSTRRTRPSMLPNFGAKVGAIELGRAMTKLLQCFSAQATRVRSCQPY